ncbi:type VII toxin-antitoxin system MntA family adenylyltransferase antitoxin [Salinibacter ruber]|jgi:predicted nucleotidyltransferase|uniref:type VII toxin-antitoxin system MntA family adenylyltransferase antitoxin n=1 Tax=Salinibacter ruber TaxID=146919 RepID=UPI000E6D2188|nr:nucleotidyltransferase domain-containing protein [Salinibacter ruber]
MILRRVIDTSAIPALSQRLQALFSEKASVRLAYVFGSQVQGNTGPLSDLDVAVLVTGACRDTPTACRARLAHKVRSCAGLDEVDLVLLSQAPIELAYHVIADGERVYEANRATRVEYEAYVLGRHGDFLPILRARREQILSESTNHRIQRYREALGRTERTLTALASASGESKH